MPEVSDKPGLRFQLVRQVPLSRAPSYESDLGPKTPSPAYVRELQDAKDTPASVPAQNVPEKTAGLAAPKGSQKPLAGQSVEDLPALAAQDAQRLVEGDFAIVDVNQRFTRAPGLIPQNIVESSEGSALNTWGATVVVGTEATDPSLFADRQTILANQTFDIAGHAVNGYAGCMAGAWMVGGVLHESADKAINMWLFADPGYIGPGFIQKFVVPHGMFVSVGAATWVAGGTKLLPLQTSDGWTQVQQTRHRSTGGIVIAGFSKVVVGFSGRIQVSRDSETTLRRWLKPEHAAALFNTESYTRNKLIALGLANPRLTYPKVSDPLKTFQIGDQLVLNVNGTFTGGAALATAVVLTGLHYTRTGEWELSIHRRQNRETDNKDTFTVALSPKKSSRGLMGVVDLPLLGEVHHGQAKSEVTRQTFMFEAASPEAMAAFHEMVINGALPGLGAIVGDVDASNGDALMNLLSIETLPKGVKRLTAEISEIPKITSTGGGLTAPRYIPGVGLAGYSYDQRRTEAKQLIASTDAAVATRTTSKLVERQRVTYTETERAYVQSRELALKGDDQTYTRGIAVGARLGVDRTRASNRSYLLNRVKGESQGSNRNWIVKIVNHAILADGAEVQTFANTRPPAAQTYNIRLERVLLSEEIALLQANVLDENASSAMRTLQQTLRDLGSAAVENPNVTHDAWAAFIQSEGVRGFGEVHRVLGDNTELDITVSNSAADDVAASRLKFTSRYLGAFSPEAQNQESLNKRARKVAGAIDSADRQHVDLRLDPFMQTFAREEQNKQLASIEADREALQALIDTGHLTDNEKKALDARLSGKAQKALAGVEQTRKPSKG